MESTEALHKEFSTEQKKEAAIATGEPWETVKEEMEQPLLLSMDPYTFEYLQGEEGVRLLVRPALPSSFRKT